MVRRYLEGAILESLRHFPVVLLTGARQVGKSTLAQGLIQSSWKANYYTADDWTAMENQGQAGSYVETWVASELLKLMPLTDHRLKLFFWRTQTGQEVDFLIERGREIFALEVKWGRRIAEGDIRNLQRCAEDLKNRIRLSAILYGGSEVLALTPDIVAIPFPAFFGVTR